MNTIRFESGERDASNDNTTQATRLLAERRDSAALRFLVVDDDPGMREVMSEYLKTDGHEVDVAPSGEAALDLQAARGYDVVITDRAMDGMNGVQLARTLKARCPDLRIILLTGFADVMASAAEPRPDCVDLVLAKPLTLNGLREALARLRET